MDAVQKTTILREPWGKHGERAAQYAQKVATAMTSSEAQDGHIPTWDGSPEKYNDYKRAVELMIDGT